MRSIPGWLTILVALSVIPAAASEETKRNVPPEGAWARYHVVIKGDDGSERAGKLTLKFLGSETDQSQACRWIEMDWKFDSFAQLEKYLVPTRALRQSDRPLDEAVRGFVRNDNDHAMELSPPDLKGPSYLVFFLRAGRQNVERIEVPQIVDYQQGRLMIKEGFRIQEKDATDSERNEPARTRQYTLWVHPDVPMGHARLTIRGWTEGSPDHVWTHDQYLEDFGFDAKSAFPP